MKIILIVLIFDLGFIAGTIWCDICENNKFLNNTGEENDNRF